MDEESVMVPKVVGMHVGISPATPDHDPMVILQIILPPEGLSVQLAHPGANGMAVVPLAFAADELQALMPEITEMLIRTRALTEMLTIWPEDRDKIMANIAFRWTGQMSQDDGDGTQEG